MSLRFSAPSDEFAERVAIASRAVSSRGMAQSLSGILLRSSGGGVELAATDLEISIRTTLGATVADDGEVLVPGRLLADVARVLPGGEVRVDHLEKENALSVVCGRAKYRLATYRVEDFPVLPEVSGDDGFSVPRDEFLGAVSRVAPAASTDNARPIMTCVLVRFADWKLTTAATDSYRIAVLETEVGEETPAFEANVPARALLELARVAGGDEVSIAPGASGNQLVLDVGDVVLTTRLISGEFPNFEQIIPRAFDHEILLPRAELLDVVRRTSVMAKDSAPVRLLFRDSELEVRARTAEVGESEETIDAPYEGEEFEIGFNPAFLLGGIEAVDGEKLKLRLLTPLRPALIEDGGLRYLVMPVRLP